MSTNEVWRDVPGYGGVYQVSDLGRVRSNTGRGGGVRSEPTILVGAKRGGYHRVVLMRDGRARAIAVHRLVLQAFEPREDADDLVAMHVNDVRDDNRLVNLKWGTVQDNVADRDAKGRRVAARGENHKMVVLSNDQVREMREAYATGAHTYRTLAKRFGVDPTQVGNIVNGKHRKDAPGPIVNVDYRLRRKGRCNDYPERE